MINKKLEIYQILLILDLNGHIVFILLEIKDSEVVDGLMLQHNQFQIDFEFLIILM